MDMAIEEKLHFHHKCLWFTLCHDHISVSHFHANGTNNVRGEYRLQSFSWDHRTLTVYSRSLFRHCAASMLPLMEMEMCAHTHTIEFPCFYCGNLKAYSLLSPKISLEIEPNFSSLIPTVCGTETVGTTRYFMSMSMEISLVHIYFQVNISR